MTRSGFGVRGNGFVQKVLLPRTSRLEGEGCSFIGQYNGMDYPAAYTPEELTIFGLSSSKRDCHYERRRICNAGYNIAFVDSSGKAYPCTSILKRIGHIYEGISFSPNLIICPFDFCGCPFSSYNPNLFQKAIDENSYILFDRGSKGLYKNYKQLMDKIHTRKYGPKIRHKHIATSFRALASIASLTRRMFVLLRRGLLKTTMGISRK